MAPARPRTLVAALLAVLALIAVPAAAQVSDTISIIKEGEDGITNVEVAGRLGEETFAQAGRVLIGRDDEFADAMTSGVLQADSPLLLVPPDGPVPDLVLEQLADLAPDEVLLMGGTTAVSEAVAEELRAGGYEVDRAAGPSRFETATAIADRGAPDTDTVLVARAFADQDSGDETQAFADALAAGGWAAEERWPILLTQSDVLTPTTREWLADRDIDTAFLLGGTAAVSAAVEAELDELVGTVERVAGADRFGTAVEIADKRGAEDAADAARITLVEGQGEDAWAGGFAAAAHSAAFDAPIVLTSGTTLPDSTADWLAGGATFAQAAEPPAPVLTCVTPFPVCEEARSVLGLPDPVTFTFEPEDGSTVEVGDELRVSVDGTVDQLALDDGCGSGVVTGGTTATTTAEEVGSCTLTATATFGSGAVQTASATFVVEPAAGPSIPQVLVLTWGDTDGQVGALRMVGVDGSDPRPVATCLQCRDLRVSGDGARAVMLQGGAITIRSAPTYDDPQVVLPSSPEFTYAHPQLTPDGDEVVVTRFADGGTDVVRVPVGGGTPTVVLADAWLTGPDAVGPSAAVPSGVGVLVYREGPIGFAGSTTALAIADLGGGGDAELWTTPSPASAALSPDGARWVMGTPTSERVLAGQTTVPAEAVATAPGDPLQVHTPVWASPTTATGIDLGQLGPRQVRIDTTTEPLGVQAAAAVPELTPFGRPEPLPDGRLLVGVQGALVRSDGSVVAEFPGAARVLDPHLVAAP